MSQPFKPESIEQVTFPGVGVEETTSAGTARATGVFAQASDVPTFWCLWNGAFADPATRTTADANLGFDPGQGFSFLDAQPGPDNANRADCEIGFHGGPAAIVRTHRSDTGQFCLLFFDDNTRAPPPQPTVTGALSAVADPAAKAVLTSLLDALNSNTGNGLIKQATT